MESFNPYEMYFDIKQISFSSLSWLRASNLIQIQIKKTWPEYSGLKPSFFLE
jgi:hypothetical protein